MSSQDDRSISSDDAPLVTQDSLPLEPTKLRDVCRCKNSKCLKRYCVCFERGDACRESCECVNCENTKDSATARLARQSAVSRKRKVADGGCTCKKSRCLKRYCDCYRAGIKCVAECKCVDCQNGRPAGAPVVERPSQKPQAAAPPSPHPLRRAMTAPPAPTPNKVEAIEALKALFAATPAPAERFVATSPRPGSPFLAIGAPGVTVVGPAPLTDLKRCATAVTEERDSPKSVLADLAATRFCHFVNDAPMGVVLEAVDQHVVVKSVTPDGAAAARFGVKVGERVWRVNGRAVGDALDFPGVIDLCRKRPVALDLVDAEA